MMVKGIVIGKMKNRIAVDSRVIQQCYDVGLVNNRLFQLAGRRIVGKMELFYRNSQQSGKTYNLAVNFSIGTGDDLRYLIGAESANTDVWSDLTNKSEFHVFLLSPGHVEFIFVEIRRHPGKIVCIKNKEGGFGRL